MKNTNIELEEGEEEVVMSSQADVYDMDDSTDVEDGAASEIQEEEEDDGVFYGTAVAEE